MHLGPDLVDRTAGRGRPQAVELGDPIVETLRFLGKRGALCLRARDRVVHAGKIRSERHVHHERQDDDADRKCDASETRVRLRFGTRRTTTLRVLRTFARTRDFVLGNTLWGNHSSDS